GLRAEVRRLARRRRPPRRPGVAPYARGSRPRGRTAGDRAGRRGSPGRGRRDGRPRHARHLELSAPAGAERARREAASARALRLPRGGRRLPRLAPALRAPGRARGAPPGENAPPPLALAARLGSDGIAAFAKAVKKGWEGVVGKDLAARYEAGRRSLRWLKVKARREAELVIGGFTLPKGSRLHFGALLVGLFDGKVLRYCGSVGTGFSDEVLLGLLEKLHPLQRDACPFAPVPREVKDATWVAPKLVAQVAYSEWTGDEKLRQPSFLGLRTDKKPIQCRWEERER